MKKYQVFLDISMDIIIEAENVDEVEDLALDSDWYEQLQYTGEVEVSDICEY